MDLQTTMEMGLILRVSQETPNEIQIITPQEGQEVICERIKLDRSITKIGVNGPWASVFKSKITKGYIQLGKSEALAATIIREGLFDAITELQDQHLQNIDAAKDRLLHEEKASQKERNIKIQEEAQEFREYLTEHNATLMDFLDFMGQWLLSGESRNIQAGFFADFSTISGLRPVWVMILGGPGEGKSAIERAIYDLIPINYKYSGRGTYAATMNQAQDLGADFLDKKCISLGDLGGRNSYIKWEETLDVYKELSSEGEYDYKRMDDSIDPETKKRRVIIIKIKGHPSVKFASTHSDGLTGQYLSRGITLSPEGSDDNVLSYRRHTRPGTFALEFRENLLNNIMPLFHSYIENILLNGTFEVINPYYFCLQEWFKKANNNKRASDMFPKLVDAVTLFNCESRHSITSHNGKTYYMATEDDNKTIADLFDITPGLTAEVVTFFNRLVRIIGQYNPDEFEQYMKGDLTIQKCKTIFTISTLKNERLKKDSSEVKEQFSTFCQTLHDAGHLCVLTKNRLGYNVYRLSSAVEIGGEAIKFTEELIKAYRDEEILNQNWGMGLTEGEVMNCMNNEKSQKSITHSFVKPPWDTLGRSTSDAFLENSNPKSNEEQI